MITSDESGVSTRMLEFTLQLADRGSANLATAWIAVAFGSSLAITHFFPIRDA